MKTGIDIVEVDRIKKQTNSFFEKNFSEKEIEYVNQFNVNKEEHYAGFFAVKEAVMKALGKGIYDISQRDIEVVHDKDGKPSVILYGKARQIFDELFFSHIEISISHIKNLAIANCVIY